MFSRLALTLSGVLFIFSWLVPNHYLPWVTAYNEFFVFFAGVCLGVVVFFRGVGPGVSASGVFFLLCALIPLLQFASGLIFFAGDALLAALYLVAFSGTLVLGGVYSAAPLKHQALSLLAFLVIIASVLSVWIALNQWLMLPGGIWVADLRPGGRPFANLAQPNNLATLLCLGLAGSLYLFETRRVGVWASSALALFLLSGITLTQSRTPWVGAVCVSLWWAWKSRELVLRLSFTAFAGWVALYVLLVLGFSSFAEALYLPAADLAERAQAVHRWALWQQLWQAVLQGPLWGYGWSQVSVAQVAVSLDFSLPLMAEHSHNIVLDLLLWNGPLLGGLFIVLLGVWLTRLGWRARTVEDVVALMAVGFVLVHGMLEFPLEYGFFLLPAGLLLGMVEAGQSESMFVLPRKALAGFLVVSAGMLVWIWYEYRVVEEDHRLMRFETARIGDVKAEHSAPDVVLLTQLREFIRFARTEATPGMAPEQIEWMRKVAHRYPYPPSLFRYSLALSLNGQPNLAKQELLRLRALHGDELYQGARLGVTSMVERYPQLEYLQLPE